MKPPSFHKRRQIRGGIGFPLHDNDGMCGVDEPDAELESAVSGADGGNAEGGR